MDRKRIFISHSTDEKNVALALKELIKESDSTIQIFCSSDYESLPKGKSPTEEIFIALEKSTDLLSLVSGESCTNQWINFETGFFYALKKRFHVLCIGDFSKGSLTGPLSMLQATALSDSIDTRQLCIEMGLSNINENLLRKLINLGKEYPSPRIKVQPYLLEINDNPSIALLIQNFSRVAKDFTKATLKVPLNIIQRNWASPDIPPILYWEKKTISNLHMKVGVLVSTEVNTPSGWPSVPRPDKIIPAEGFLDTQEYFLRIPLIRDQTNSDKEISYEVVVDGRTISGHSKIQDLPLKDHRASLRPGSMIKYLQKIDQVPDKMCGSVSWKHLSKTSEDEIALDEFGIEYRIKDQKEDLVLVKKV